MTAEPQVAGVFAATPTQRAMLGGADPARDYLSHLVLEFEGPLDAGAFLRAWQQVVRRHTVLRTGFLRDASEQLYQVVRDDAELTLDMLQACDSGAVEYRIAEDRARGFALDTPPLMRLALWPAGTRRHVLVWCHHHAILDGWSLQLLLAEAIEAYRALREGSRPNLAPTRGFDSYLQWLKRRDVGRDLAIWKEHLGGFAAPVSIGHARPMALNDGPRFATVDRTGGARLAQGLQLASQLWRVTPALLVQAAWAACLAHLSGQDDVVLGTTRSGRPSTLSDADRIAGPFLVTTPLRVRLKRESALADWVRQLSLAAVQVDEHAHLDPLRIQTQSEVPLDRALFESAVVVQNYASGTAQLAGGGLAADVRTLRVEGGEGAFALLVSASVDDALHLKFRHDCRRLSTDEAGGVATALLALIEGLVSGDCGTVQQWLAWAPSHSRGLWSSRTTTPTSWSAPVGDTETQVARTWSELAGRPVGRDEDFFAAGGHSLLAIEIGTRLAKALSKPVSLQLIYAHRTVRAIAAALEGLAANDSAASQGEEGAWRPEPAARHEPFPLTALQRAYWIGRQTSLSLGGRGSFAMVEVRLDPLIDARRIEPAWNRLLARHPMLRAVLTPEGQQRVPQVVPHVEVPCWDFAAGSPVPSLEALRGTLRRQVEDVHTGPLFALALSRDAGSTHLHVAYDPIVCDAGSFTLLAQELGLLVRDSKANLPAIGLDFRDHVLACARLRDGAAGANDRRYWEQRLDRLPPAPELPVGLEQDGRERFARRQLQLAAPAWSAVVGLCAKLSVTPSAFLIGAYGLVVAAWARRRHFCLNLTLFNRQPLHPDVHRLVGDFTTLTLLETDLREARTLAQAVERVQAQLVADLDHRWVDGVDVLRWLSGRQAGQPVLMPVVFTSTLGQGGGAPAGAAPLGEVVRGYGQTPQVYLDCQVMEHDGTLHCWWDSLDVIFPAGMVDDMFAAFERLLLQAAQDASSVHREAPMLSEASSQARLSLNATAAACPEGTLHGLFVAQAARTPSAMAIIASERTLSYAELDAASARLAWHIAQETEPAGRVAVLTPLDSEQAVVSLAVLRAGRTLVRLSPDWPAARSQAVLEITGASLILVHAGVAPLQLPPHTRRLDIDVDGAAPVPPRLADPMQPEALAYVMFTSGSTGEPKGIAITHRAAVNTVVDINRRLQAGARDRVLAISVATFDLSIYDLFGMLAVGGAAVFVQPQRRSDPSHWLDVMSRFAVTLWNSTPALMEMLAEQMSMAPQQRPPLRAAMLSGDLIPIGMAQRIQGHWPGLRVIGLGGATEAAIWSVWHEIDRALPGWPSVPYGAPLANQSIHVLDSLLQPCPDWAIGDLYIGGLGLAQGYFRRPELTAASFITHPGAGERLYRTGDLARFRPGALLEFLGREDGQVKVRGYRIELGEIEFHLGHQPGVAQAVAVTHHNTLRGFVVADASGFVPDEHELRLGLAQVLPSHAVPTSIQVIDAMPLTPNGKVDRGALSTLRARGSANRAEAAHDPAVAIVVRVAQDVLQVDAIAPDDDLFLVGADSVSALQIAARLRAETGRRIELAALFSLRTPQALAGAIRSQAIQEADPIEPCPAGVAIPATSMQQRLWLLDRVEPGNPRYIIPGTVPLGGSVDLDALRAALADLLERHEPLRTALCHTPAGLCQVILPLPASPIEALDGELDAQALDASFDEFARRPFDLGEHLPARFRLVRLRGGGRVLQFAIHHVAVDAWSMGVMAEDLAGLYAARRGAQTALRPLSVRYADFAHWEQRRLSSARSAQAQAWWNQALRDLPAQAFDDGGPPQTGPVVVPVAIDRETTTALRACAERTGATLYMVLLSLFAAALRQRGAPADLAIASSTNGRIRPELESLVGCFVNLVLVRVDVGGDVPLDELVARVRAFALEAFAHQDLPFEMALAAARRGQGQGGAPYAAVFVLQNNPARAVQADDIDFRMKDLDVEGSRYPIHLHLSETDDGLRGALRGESSPLRASRMAALARDFSGLARSACAQPQHSLRALLAEDAPAEDAPAEDAPAEDARRAARQQRLAALRRAPAERETP